jgi:hypothetical protein
MFAIARNGFLTVYDDDRVGFCAERVAAPASAAGFHSRTVTSPMHSPSASVIDCDGPRGAGVRTRRPRSRAQFARIADFGDLRLLIAVAGRL